jgi:glycosyltransferase involved in cell wall biosynthesis
MKLGLIARANNRGLGTLSWEFYRHLKPYKTVAISLPFDEQELVNRFPDAQVVRGVHDHAYDHLSDCNIVLSFETVYNDQAVINLKRLNPKIVFVLMPMFEQQDGKGANAWIIPTVWNYGYWGQPKIYLPVPIDRQRLPFKLRTKAKVFVHNGGMQWGDDRNGTLTVLKAMQFVKADIRLVVRFQKFPDKMYNEVRTLLEKDPRIEFDTTAYPNYWDIWQGGDVFIYPRAYAGLALPTNEAMSSGLPVVMTDMNPQNEYLPKELLIETKRKFMIDMFRPIEACEVEPRMVAKKMDELANMDITKLSLQMNHIAEHWSWEAMLPKYNNFFKQCLLQPKE